MKTQLLLFLSIFYITFVSYAQWSPDFRITNDAFYSGAPCTFVSGSYIHVVWGDVRDGNTEIYYKNSSNNGLSWGSETRLSNDPNYSYGPTVVVSGTVVHVVWRDTRSGMGTRVHYKRSPDNGLTWGSDTSLTYAGASTPFISADGSLIGIVWEDFRYGNNEIYFKRSTNNGITWQTETRLTNNINISEDPNIKVSGLNVHLVWCDNRDENKEIYYKFSSDGGLIWGTDVKLTNDPSESTSPRVSTYGTTIHITWSEHNTYGTEIYYKRSTDLGVTWGANTRLTYDHFSYAPFMLVSAATIHLVWQDSRNSNAEIYYKRSTDEGFSWESDTRLTYNPSWVLSASLGVSGTYIHVVWDDDRDGHYEVYYKRNPTGNPIGVTVIGNEITKEFSLSQNYPNPFNPATKIKFQIPKTGYVSLQIYDAVGRNVARLVDQNLNPGIYEAEWNAVSQPSGIYFYRITASEFSEVKKMVLVK